MKSLVPFAIFALFLETGFTLPSGKCFISYPSVSKSENKPYINLGTLVIDSLTFTKIQKQ